MAKKKQKDKITLLYSSRQASFSVATAKMKSFLHALSLLGSGFELDEIDVEKRKDKAKKFKYSDKSLPVLFLKNKAIFKGSSATSTQKNNGASFEDAILASIGEGVFVVNRDFNVLRVNNVALEFIRKKKPSVLGDIYDDHFIITDEDGKIKRHGLSDIIVSCFWTGYNRLESQGFFMLGTRAIDKPIRVPVSIAAAPVKNKKNNILAVVVSFRDISWEVQADRMKTEFVSVASHQLRTPITGIRLFSEMLFNEEVGKINKRQKEYLDNIQKSTIRMIALINDLLNISRMETGRLRVEPVETQLEDFLKDIVNEHKPIAKNKKIKLTFKKPEKKLPKVLIDQTLMKHAYENLIANAIRYTPEGGKVDVLLKKSSSGYVFSVSDNGIGMSLEDKSRIFEKFYRSDSARKMETDGSGLGLYICQMIVAASGGRIWFRSKEGKGSIFYIEISKEGSRSQSGEKSLV